MLGADTSKFVYVPLDVVMRYHARAHISQPALCQPTGMAPAAAYEARDAHWVPTGNLSAPTRERPQSSPAKPAVKGGKPPLAKPIAGAFTAAALDCSTKSRAREIPRIFADGRPGPKPLRAEAHPEGLPGLDPKNQRRVDVDNAACSWILKQLQAIADDGRGALRENPARSLHWSLPQEETMMESGLWYDTTYSACVFMSARCKHQRLRHNIHEIELIHPRECHHQHAAWEWDPWEDTQGRHQFPSRAEYSATLAFAIAVSVSWWAVREGHARLHVPRMPPLEACG